MSTAEWFGAIRRPILIGERLNAAGNARLAARLAAGEWDAVGEEARAQAAAGADALDVNGALAGADERATLLEMVARARAACDLPLAVDTRDPGLLVEACRAAAPRALANSLPATRDALERHLPALARLGVPVVGLAMDEAGVPPSAGGRAACAARFVAAGRALGIPSDRLLVDCLARPGGDDPVSANAETLAAMRLVKERLGTPLVLGISNVSFPSAAPAKGGSPAPRRAANLAFLAAALAAGLDAAIADPLDAAVRRAVAAARGGRSPAPPRASCSPSEKEVLGWLS
jgi:5-methyltetrahydrofolate--homocysteine methyltransferase